ncbi:MAG TPA: hypothetical protein VIJ51_01495, partial [Solirubrobacteraceae bacterium]
GPADDASASADEPLAPAAPALPPADRAPEAADSADRASAPASPTPADVAPADVAPADPTGRPVPPSPADSPLDRSGNPLILQAPTTAPDQDAPTRPTLSSQEPLTLERIIAVWPAVLAAVGTANRMLAAVVADAVPVELTDHRLLLAFPADGGFLRRKAEDSPNRVAVADAVRAVTGRTLTLAYDLRELASPTDPPATLTDAEWVARLKVEFDAHELDA